MTVGELLNRISSRELSEWLAYFSIKAEEEERKDLERRAQRGLQQRKAQR